MEKWTEGYMGAHWDGPYNDDSDDDEPHLMTCECEDCMQNYPERFFIEDDGIWVNIHRQED